MNCSPPRWPDWLPKTTHVRPKIDPEDTTRCSDRRMELNNLHL